MMLKNRKTNLTWYKVDMSKKLIMNNNQQSADKNVLCFFMFGYNKEIV